MRTHSPNRANRPRPAEELSWSSFHLMASHRHWSLDPALRQEPLISLADSTFDVGWLVAKLNLCLADVCAPVHCQNADSRWSQELLCIWPKVWNDGLGSVRNQ